ncbi:MAG: hypothetical protein FH749_12700 [Firmicutes bacterium]|nr:hypothetical protein [Bacillota bacterium]
MELDSYEAIKFVYQSYVDSKPYLTTDADIHRRHPRYTRELITRLGLSLSEPPTALIAGSKGKGSTSTLLACLLEHAGRHVGLFTGPHLVDFCERIRVNGIKIDEENFVRLIQNLMPVANEITQAMPRDHYLGPVGTTLAVALQWYQEQQTDFNVVECGRGGVSDDASVLHNQWSVLTPIMEEHVRELGPTLLDIAANKAGIVRPGQKLCVTCQQHTQVSTLLRSLCRHFAVPLKQEGADFTVEALQSDLSGSRFYYRSQAREAEFKLPLVGRFQIINAALALATAEEILPGTTDDELQAGLDAARWPGRCELVPGRPPVLLDGAINAQSAQYVAAVLQELAPPLHLVTGVPADKDWRGVLSVLAPLAASVTVTTATNPHLEFPAREEVLATAEGLNGKCEYVQDPEAALDRALAAAQTGTVVIVGTQSLVRDAKVFLSNKNTGEGSR